MKEERTAWPEGIKKTKQRECVLSVLERAAMPLSAMDICSQAQRDDCSVWLSTVYRILELFVKENVVEKTTFLDNDTAFYELKRPHHKHYAVCLNCRKVVEMDNCPLEEFIPELSDGDFRILGHKIEMYGICKDCDKNKGNCGGGSC